jgi:hypothetical protein
LSTDERNGLYNEIWDTYIKWKKDQKDKTVTRNKKTETRIRNQQGFFYLALFTDALQLEP